MTKGTRITRRQAFLLGLGAFASVNALPMVGKLKELNSQFKTIQAAQKSEDRNFPVVGSTTLRQRALAKKLLYGGAASYSELNPDSNFATSIKQECAMFMATADLLWNTLRPSQEKFDFTKGDWLVEFARTNNMLLGGTHLVWHYAMPDWFEKTINKENAEHLLLEHIEKVAGHYAGKVHLWTVVNEAVEPNDGRADGLRKTPWLEFLGPDYIDMAFRAAAKADPNALLLYNDYGLEFNKPDHEARRTAVLKLLERLKSKGTPIYALGMQSHIWYEPRFEPKKLQAFMRDVADLGLKILITEMDVGDSELPVDHKVRDRIVAAIYEDYLSAVLEEPAVIAAITWGLSDKYTWLSWSPRKDGTSVRPLPLDANMNRKLAWNAIARAFDESPKRDSSSSLWNSWENLNQETRE